MVTERRVKLTWLLVSSVIILSSAGMLFQMQDSEPLLSMTAAKMLIPVALTLLHASMVFSRFRGILLVSLSFLTGLVFEAAGLRYGFLFGGPYAYNSQEFGPMLLGVPLIVPLYWAVFIYLGYSITTSFLIWTGRQKPSQRGNDLGLLLLLILLDGLTVVAIDLLMDPLMVFHGKWFWPQGGPYFGIPVGNFVAWFLVTAFATGLFRGFEWRFPGQPKLVDNALHIAPVVAYAVLGGSLAVLALDAHLGNVAFAGAAVMLPVVGANLYCFLFWRTDSQPREPAGRTEHSLHRPPF
jgi:uncharacterized membrane protein